MNLSEFKKLLGADPWRQEPESRHTNPETDREFERAVEQAESFERQLEATLTVPVDGAWLESCIAGSHTAPPFRAPRWLALAASVLIVTGIAAVVWQQTRPPQDVQEYVAEHLSHDGQKLLDRAGGPVGGAQIARVLTGLGVTAGQPLSERVRLIKYCPTPDGRGAHMIVDTGAGNVHLIFMPETGVNDGREFGVGTMRAHLVALPAGSAVIVGAPGQPLQQVDSWVRQSINPLPART